MCFVLYLCIFTISFNLFLSLDIFGDDKILGLKLNNVEVDLSTIGINLDLQCKPQTVSLNVNVGDLVTLTVYNVHSQITFDANVDINGDSYQCNLDTCSSNSSKPLSTYFDNRYGFMGERNEIHDFYFQITNNLAYPSFAFRTDYPSNIPIFYKNRIRILDSSINIDNWSILLVESIKYGKLLEQNSIELQSEKGAIIPLSSITRIYYSPGNDNFAVLDHFIFKLFEGSNYSPMTIIPIVVCDEGCFGCDENFVERATEQKECYFCKTDYYKYENRCYQNCPEGTFSVESNKICSKTCSSKYLYIDNKTNSCVDSCPDDYYVYKDNCYNDKCPDGTYTLDHICYDTCPSDYYTYNELMICLKHCPDANSLLYQNECYSHCPDNTFLLLLDNVCYDICPSPYLHFIDGMTCVSQCPLNYVQYKNYCYSLCPEETYYISQLRLCVDECTIEPYIIYNRVDSDNLQCVTDEGCPDKYIVKNGECTFFIEEKSDDNTMYSTDIDKNDILNNYIDEIPSNISLKGDDFIFQSFPADQEMSPTDGASVIDFSNCIEILKQNPQYENSNFTVVKFDIDRENSTVKQVEYKLLDEKGNEVPLELCQNETIEIKYTLDPTTPGIDFEKVKELAESGIDIFDPDSPFFNDICVPYTSSNGTDIPLKDRRKDLMQNISLCEEGCTYKSFNAVTYEVVCDCNIKEDFSFDEKELDVPSFKTLVDSTNINIIKCYKLLLNFDNYIDNIGFFIYLGVFLLLVALIFIYYCYSYQEFLKLLFFDTPHPNPSLFFVINKLSTTRERNSIFESTDRTLNDSDKSQSKIEDNNTSNKLKEKETDREKEDESINMDESPFIVASEKDKRQCNIMFWDLFLSKIEFINILFYPGKFDIFSLNISLYLFMIPLEFTMNSLLFTDDVISQNYKNGGKMSFTTSWILSFVSGLLTSIVGFAFVRLSKVAPYFEVIDKEIKDEKTYMIMCRKVMRKIRVRIVVYYVLEIIFVIAFCYYITIFCTVYHNNQMKWLMDCFMGIISDLFFTLILSITCTIIRYIGIKTQSEKLYNISQYTSDKFL